ncbi:AlpA family phage regulatory protein [Alteromonas sp. MmMcT2-5]|uniref:helix-turn-helix transcriptional regulator n=1 Tax=Alteromonas sp. MmMcT2-5 TaxID=2917733 RepID=UPI001EF3C770|nr:AlpA family phage regulatory protein [Alteromonas sp. MmMcT2-5]MCG7651611.1 AlpA family phage regulatory protein [Alteromonas sp. MmMcT2-5]
MVKTYPTIIRKNEVIRNTGFSKSTLHNRINAGLWPTPISLGARAVGFVLSECEIVLKAMIAGHSSEEIKSLVSDLINQRKNCVFR